VTIFTLPPVRCSVFSFTSASFARAAISMLDAPPLIGSAVGISARSPSGSSKLIPRSSSSGSLAAAL
jgi:hypothetical protein